jgi:leucine-rich repeat protein SHOC2
MRWGIYLSIPQVFSNLKNLLMEQVEEIIEQARVDRSPKLSLNDNQITTLPQSIDGLIDLSYLNLRNNYLTSLTKNISSLSSLDYLFLDNNRLSILPENLGNLSNLTYLSLYNNQLNFLPESIGDLVNLRSLYLNDNQLTALPNSISRLTKLTTLTIEGNPLTDLSILQYLPSLERILFFGINLPHRYWIKFSEWKPEWLLDEDNAEIRRTLVEQVGYEKICEDLSALTLDTWKEYTLLKIDEVEVIYEDEDEPIEREPMVLLKMTCPSTGHIHILRVPPEMTSAEAAITWVNHGIHPDKFAIQT